MVLNAQKIMGALTSNDQSVGAVVLNAQKYGSSPFRRPKIWELSPQTVKVREFSL